MERGAGQRAVREVRARVTLQTVPDDAWRRRVEGREAWARAVGVRGGRRLALGMASRGVTRVWRRRAVRGVQCMCQ